MRHCIGSYPMPRNRSESASAPARIFSAVNGSGANSGDERSSSFGSKPTINTFLARAMTFPPSVDGSRVVEAFVQKRSGQVEGATTAAEFLDVELEDVMQFFPHLESNTRAVA